MRNMLLGGSHTAMALGSDGPMVAHKDSVLPHKYFTTGFPSLCNNSPAQGKQLAVDTAPASGSSTTDLMADLGKSTHLIKG